MIARVKDQYPLLGVLGAARVRTRRQGRTYMVANCPFPNHDDSSLSFRVKLSATNRRIKETPAMAARLTDQPL